ncbi:MAG: regulatory protein RecX [Chloroflexi bacterium]|nr:regulatory protein RecX [Chloroflexota bacterium]
MDNAAPAYRILALRPARRGRVRVLWDGGEPFSLAADLAQTLQPGQILTAQQVEALRQADAQRRAWDLVTRRLARRLFTRHELRQYLQRRGFSDTVIQATFERLDSLGWLDDHRFARMWVENQSHFRPRGKARLRAELRAKGVPDEAIEEALGQVDEERLAWDLARRVLPRYQHLEWSAFQRRLGGYLARRGFPLALVRTILRTLWQEVHPGTLEPEA